MKYIFFFFLIIQFSAVAQDKICDVTLLRGEVKILLPNGKTEDVTKDTVIFEGASLKTGESSFVKLSFIDKSLMTLGSNSSVKITSFTKESPGIISLLHGEIRAQVTKDYMEMEDKEKSKLFIRTKTAAMGIRGTDFQVSFSNKLEETTLVTFEGKVAMNKIDSGMRGSDLNQRDLDKILDRKDRVVVTRGEVSNINRDTQRIGPPQKMDQKVMDNMMKSEVPRDNGMMERRQNNPQGENQKDDRKQQNEKPGERSTGGPEEKQGGPGSGPGGNQGGPGGGPGGNQGGPGGGSGGNQGGPGGGPGGNQSGPGGGSGENGNQQRQGPGNDRGGRGQQDEHREQPMNNNNNNAPKNDNRNQSPPPR